MLCKKDIVHDLRVRVLRIANWMMRYILFQLNLD